MRHICGYELNKPCRKKDIEYPQSCQTADLREQYSKQDACCDTTQFLRTNPNMVCASAQHLGTRCTYSKYLFPLNSRYTNTIS